jgi:hypothetical protein
MRPPVMCLAIARESQAATYLVFLAAEALEIAPRCLVHGVWAWSVPRSKAVRERTYPYRQG